MERKIRSTKRKLRGRREGEGEEDSGLIELLMFPDRPAGIPHEEWAQYQQLEYEVMEAERILQNLRARLVAAKKHLAGRIEGQRLQDNSLECLAAAVPITEILQ